MSAKASKVKCDFTNLPKLSNGHIDWKSSVNHEFTFYNGTQSGIIKIVNSVRENNQTKLEIEYDGRRKIIDYTNLHKGYIQNFISDVHRREYSIGEIVNTDRGNSFVVLQVSVRKNTNVSPVGFHPYYRVRCLKCGMDDYKLGQSLNQAGCLCCSGFQVFSGINDIGSTDPWLSEYFQNPIDARNHTHGEMTKIYPKCPYCGKVSEKPYSINTLYQSKGFSCACKGSGMSYPEKYMSSLLDQLGIKYIRQATTCHLKFDVDSKMYDFYDAHNSCIIETHGPQHYEDWIPQNNWRTYEDEHANDVFKETVARQNGIQHYIIVDCRKSYNEYMKHSILASGLLETYGVSKSDIDWEQCNRYATSNIVKNVCDDFMKYLYHNDTLAEIYHISNQTVRDYIRRGAELGWSDYSLYTLITSKRIQIKMYNDNEIHLFRIKGDLRLFFEQNKQSFDMMVVNRIIDTGKSYKGYVFETVNDLNTLLQIAHDGENVYSPSNF